MADLKKRRSAARGWSTRAHTSLCTLLEGDIDKYMLVDAIEEFDKRLLALDQIQSDYELTCDDIDAEIEEAATFRNKLKEVRIRAGQMMSRCQEDNEHTLPCSTFSTKPDVKLPKLVLPTFGGDYLEWQSFWDQFQAVVDKSDLPEVSKFTYLRSLLTGEAMEAIKGLSLTAAHYQEACEILENRFGRKERIIFSHVQALLNMVHKSSFMNLRKLQDQVTSHVRSLESLGIEGTQYGVLLTPIVLSCLPPDIRMEWARTSEGRESELQWLLVFLDKELKLRETSQTFKALNSSQEERKMSAGKYNGKSHVPHSNRTPSAAALQSSSTTYSCLICGKSHLTSRCWELTRVNQEERRGKLKKKGLCFRCLDNGHLATDCEKKCGKCQGSHHIVLCRKLGNGKDRQKAEYTTQSQVSGEPGAAMCALKGEPSAVLLQTIELQVKGQNGTVKATALFDTGSDRTYMSSDLVQSINPEFCKSESVSYCAFGGSKSSGAKLSSVYRFEISGKSGRGVLKATEVPIICASIHRRGVRGDILKDLKNLDLAADYGKPLTMKIDLLIGLDQYWKFILPDIVPLGDDCNLVAQRSVFGWILSGASSSKVSRESGTVSHQLLCVQGVEQVDFRRSWDVDIESPDTGESAVLQKFTEGIVLSEGRYEVALPWKSENKRKELCDNYDQAKQRLNSLCRKLERDPSLKERYDGALREMENSHVIEEVPTQEVHSRNPTFYLPHRPVVKEASLTTKVRPVFDASARDRNQLSLNDCVETGPNMIPSLVEILLRFRRWPIAIVADIQKAFLQISVTPVDRDVHRFLWKDNGLVRIMRFTRVPFGNRCSPFILNATIKHHLKQFQDTDVISELQENLYVDDWLSGADSEDVAAKMIEEARHVMAQCSMNLTKWESNSKDVLDKTTYNMPNVECEHSCNVKILGLGWNPDEDCFKFDGIALKPDLVITKRVVLSIIARFFDPLGLLNPFVVKLKILFQDLWKLGVQWDREVPEEICFQVKSWMDDLQLMKRWSVPRPYAVGSWKDIESMRLHAFGDASEKAYGACVYLTARKNNSITSSLVIAKARVTSVKSVTLPRLELLGAVMAAQLLEFVRNSLKLGKDCCRCWSDSTVALSWIKGDPGRWKPFVANRVELIQNLTCPSQWSHCPGTENPADLLTRGISASDLLESELWLSGPSFLVSDAVSVQSKYPEDAHEVNEEETNETLLSVKPVVTLFEVERWGTLTKAIRVVAWVLRFIKKIRARAFTGPLSFNELEGAKVVLIQQVQRQAFQQEINDLQRSNVVAQKSKLYKCSPYLDENGLIRMKGRLDYSELSFEEKHPIIIPKSHLALLLIQFEHLLLKHGGVNAMLTALRYSYWIFGARRMAKKVKRFCMPCQKHDNKKLEQPAAPLHAGRVKKSKPFSVVGVDHAGPLYCVDHAGKKFYILLFTCAVVRAVHLELVDSLNLDACVLAIRRFVARRGLPSVIWSDNAKTFVFASQKLSDVYGDRCPKWNFIVPRSPWWGGYWERLVQSVKKALRKSVGLKCLTRTELETVLHEIEACVNSRPLTFVGDEIDSRSPLTPMHFLLGRSNVYEQSDSHDSPVTKNDLLDRKLVQDAILDQFWTVWSEEYIRSLPSWRGPSRLANFGVGSLVLVREDGRPRSLWPLGVVSETYLGKDKIVRSCKLRTKRGDIVRSVQRLHHLEMESDSLELSSDESEEIVNDKLPVDKVANLEENPVEDPGDVPVSRFGRKIRSVRKLDL